MLNDLPVDTQILENLDISHFDPMLKDYVFSSFFLARMVSKTMDENKRLTLENATLKAECAELKGRFEELKKVLDGLESVGATSYTAEFEKHASDESAGEQKANGFMEKNRADLEGMLNGEADEVVVTAGNGDVVDIGELAIDEPIPDDITVDDGVVDILADITDAAPEVMAESEPEVMAEAEPEAMAEAEPEVMADAAPEVMAEAAPEVMAEAEPEVMAEAELEAMAEAELLPDITAPVDEAPADVPMSSSTDDIEAMASALIDVLGIDEPMPEPAAAPEPVVEIAAEPEAVAAPVAEPEPAAAAPAIEIPSDPNAALTPEQIAALFAAAN